MKSYLLGILLLVSFVTSAQIVVTGKVTDENKEPLGGANVLVKGTSLGTSTDFDGEYSIEVGEGQSLEFGYTGYASKTIKISQGKIVVNVSLEPSTELGEVVITALGISKDQRKLGYAVTEISASRFTKARETNIANSLSGTVAGLNVSSTSSGPGGTSKILLRGMPSINSGGSPLIVINGVPMDNTQRGSAGEWGGSDDGDGIGNLNPDDIEKMTVLKGQSASALYGARASNGVILITTKKGKKGTWEVGYNTNFMADVVADFTNFQKTFGQGVQGKRPSNEDTALKSNTLAWGERMDGAELTQYNGKKYNYAVAPNNYTEYYRMGTNFTNTVSVTKGLGNGSFRLSFANLSSKAIVPGSGLVRNTINLNIDQNITDKLSVSMMTNYIDQTTNNAIGLSDAPRNPNNFLFLAPNVDPTIFSPGYDSKGDEITFSDDIYVTNPYFVSNKNVKDLGRKRMISMMSSKYNFSKKMYLMGRVGYDVSHDRKLDVEPTGQAYTNKKQGNLKEQSFSERSELNVTGIFGRDFSISDDLQFSGILGATLRKNKYEKVAIGGNNFVLPLLYTPSNTLTFSRTYDFVSSEVQSAYYSFDLTFAKYLTLTNTGRYDIYSSLPSGNRDIFAPSLSAGFVFSDLINIPSLNYGKFRISYAVTSGEPTPYQTQLYYSLNNAINEESRASFGEDLPNLNLKPFTLSEFAFGVDLRFLDKRLTLDASYFLKQTNNEIIKANYSRASGFTTGLIASGSVRNQGLELLLTGVPIRMPDFGWTSSLNLTSLSNEVIKTASDNKPIILGRNRGTLGNAVTAFVPGEAGPQILAYEPKLDSSGKMEVDASGLPLKAEKLTSQGTVLPTLYGGWNNQFSYKNFNFSFLLGYSFGNKILSATQYYSIFRGLEKMTLNGRESGITTNGVTASAQNYYQNLAQNVTSTSVVSGDFIKLRQLSLGYNIPKDFISKLSFINSIDISVVARNLFILYKVAENIDPENTFSSNVKYAGIEGNSLPSTRSIGINLNFKIK